MNFAKIVRIKSDEKRIEHIEAELEEHFWDGELADAMQEGGWPVKVCLAGLEDTSGKDADVFTFNVKVTFAEAVPTSCGDIAPEHPGMALFMLTIYRDGGDHELSLEESWMIPSVGSDIY